jgi:Na+/H+ antiporter NhaD/arsenite permease-like protein
LIILNGFPGEEIESFFTKASARQVYLGSIFLTSFLDNVVLTHLGTQIQGLSEAHRYYLVAGGLAGGGLTLFANAPNLLGYQVLKKKFPDLKAWQCTMGALFPTLIAILFFWKKTF